LNAQGALTLGKRPPVLTEQEVGSPTTGINMVAKKNPNFLGNQIQIIQSTDANCTGQDIQAPS